MLNVIKLLVTEFKTWKAYKNLWNLVSHQDPADTPMPDPEPLRMYVLVRRDVLPLVHCGVQAAHALVEFSNKFKDTKRYKRWAETDKTLLFLEATEHDIQDLINYCNSTRIDYADFIEPDINLKTAIAIQPMTRTEGKIIFGKFKLLK